LALHNTSDLAKWLSAAQLGDKISYEKFLVAVSNLLKSFLLKRMGDPDLVEDVLQESLLAIHRSRHTYRPEKPVEPWLYAICEHRMVDFYRKYRRIEKMEITTVDDFDDIVHANADNSQHNIGESILEALTHLPEKQRQVIELLKIKDLSVKETAIRMNMSESLVKVTAFRGYQAIRRQLKMSKL